MRHSHNRRRKLDDPHRLQGGFSFAKKNLGAGAAEVAPERSGGFNGAY